MYFQIIFPHKIKCDIKVEVAIERIVIEVI